MSLEKSEFKQAVLTEVGVKVEQFLDECEKRVQQAHGAKAALQLQAKNTLLIANAIDKELAEEDLGTIKLVKDWVMKTYHALNSAAQHATNLELQIQGEVAAQKQVHDMLQKQVEFERNKIEEHLKAPIDGILAGKNRPIGVRPISVKSQREVMAAKAKPGPKPKSKAKQQKSEKVEVVANG